MSLRDELSRIADTAPVADVPRDTWHRALRAQRRDRVAAVVAAAAAVTVVAGLVAWLPERTEAPVADSSSLGVPDHLYAVPDRLSEHSGDVGWSHDAVTRDVRTGVAAAAWLAGQGAVPVVVDARSGRYHLLDLPGYAGNNWVMAVGVRTPTVALSPDGRSLAYSWASFGRASTTEPIPSGVRVVDLTTGATRSYPLPGDEGTAVTALAWSRDGRWLAWTGARMASWTTRSMGAGTPVLGRISLADGRTRELLSRRVDTFDPDLGVDEDGTVTLAGNGPLIRWDGRRPASVDGSTTAPVALASYGEGALVIAEGSRRRRIDLGAVGDEARVRPLGWVGESVLALSSSTGQPDSALHLVPTSGGRPRIVGVLDGGIESSLSVAVDLVTAESPTVTRPEPDWPWSDERLSLTIGLGVAAALSVLYGLRHLWRRRRL